MKVNLPVTDHEVPLNDDTLIVSRTDLKGLITYCNKDFIDISGFAEAELLGKNHNIVRHPDMPPVAFQDLWDTMKAGRPWSGIVKNRCKNGDFYWVEANVTPVFERGQCIGYLSVRTKPSRAKVDAAAALYRAVNEGTAKNIRLEEGRVLKTGWTAKLNFFGRFFEHARMGSKFALAGAVLLIPLLLTLALIGMNLKESIDATAKERSGLEYHAALRKVLQDVQKHRGLMGMYLSGDASARDKLLAVEASLGATIKSADELDKKHGAAMDTGKRMELLRSRWENLKTESWKMTAARSFGAHTEFIGELEGLMDQVNDGAGLTLDPELVTYHLFNAVVAQLPRLVEAMGQARAGGGIAVVQKKAEGDLKVTLIGQLAQATNLVEAMERSAKRALEADRGLEASLGRPFGETLAMVRDFNALLDGKVIRPAAIELKPEQYFNAATTTIDGGFALYDKGAPALEGLLAARQARLLRQGAWTLGAALLIFALGAGLALLVVRRTSNQLALAAASFAEIGQGNFRNQIDSCGEDEVADLLRALRMMQTKLGNDVNEAREKADAALRLKIGLDSVSTNVMIADNARNIIYMNPAVKAMMKGAEADIRKELPHFDADRLVGGSMDGFHKNPEHQARLLATFTSAYRATVRIGGRTFALAASPVINERGERLGSAVEWLDRTAEVAVEQEVSDIVQAAASGDFSRRIGTENKQGFFLELAKHMNGLMETASRGLDEVAAVLSALAGGVLTRKVEGEYGGTFLRLKDDTNACVENLREMVMKIKEATDSINSAAQEIAAGSTDLSSRTEEQASSLEETASSMEELNATVKQNAQNAMAADELAKQANEAVSRGGQVVRQVVDTMGEIQGSSRKIAEIIGVIDSIAFQTNILALNAAVEAARAGEQGRGFAVVAAEVRSLAQRSATAAKEIKGLIASSVERVDEGAKLVGEAGNTMDEVVASFRKVAGIMQDIAAASREQSSGIEQVTQAVSQMDEVTQQNAALVEEASASAEQMEDQARTLASAVATFRLSESDANAAIEAAAATSKVTKFPSARKPKAAATKAAAPARKLAAAKPVPSDDEWEEF